MGFKSKATKKNKAKKVDRKPIKRAGAGMIWGGMSTHQPVAQWSKGVGGDGYTQKVNHCRRFKEGDKWNDGQDLKDVPREPGDYMRQPGL